jgi:hypothetical protein
MSQWVIIKTGKLFGRLAMLKNKDKNPPKKHGNIPL